MKAIYLCNSEIVWTVIQHNKKWVDTSIFRCEDTHPPQENSSDVMMEQRLLLTFVDLRSNNDAINWGDLQSLDPVQCRWMFYILDCLHNLVVKLLYHYITGVFLTRMCVFTSKYWGVYSFFMVLNDCLSYFAVILTTRIKIQLDIYVRLPVLDRKLLVVLAKYQ